MTNEESITRTTGHDEATVQRGVRWRPAKASQPASVFLRFEEPGQALEGTWLGWGEGPFGDVGQIETRHGVKKFSPSAVLRSHLDDVDAGTRVKITFEGWNTSKSGRRYRVFDVLVAEGGEGQ